MSQCTTGDTPITTRLTEMEPNSDVADVQSVNRRESEVHIAVNTGLAGFSRPTRPNTRSHTRKQQAGNSLLVSPLKEKPKVRIVRPRQPNPKMKAVRKIARHRWEDDLTGTESGGSVSSTPEDDDGNETLEQSHLDTTSQSEYDVHLAKSSSDTSLQTGNDEDVAEGSLDTTSRNESDTSPFAENSSDTSLRLRNDDVPGNDVNVGNDVNIANDVTTENGQPRGAWPSQKRCHTRP